MNRRKSKLTHSQGCRRYSICPWRGRYNDGWWNELSALLMISPSIYISNLFLSYYRNRTGNMLLPPAMPVSKQSTGQVLLAHWSNTLKVGFSFLWQAILQSSARSQIYQRATLNVSLIFYHLSIYTGNS